MLLFSPQVPQDEWGGYPGSNKDDEIPCRRMRSSSYVKAMGDEESGESDSSPKSSPQKSARSDALVKSVLQRQLSDSQRYVQLTVIPSSARCSKFFFFSSFSFAYSVHHAFGCSVSHASYPAPWWCGGGMAATSCTLVYYMHQSMHTVLLRLIPTSGSTRQQQGKVFVWCSLSIHCEISFF